MNMNKLPLRQKPICTFSEYQAMVERTDERKKVMVSLLGLAGELGDINSTFKKLFLQRDSRTLREDLREDIGDILWYLTSLAILYKIPLKDVARESARKAELTDGYKAWTIRPPAAA